jgi:cell division protein ZapE
MSQDQDNPKSQKEASKGPLFAYRARREAGDLQRDAAQELAAEKLQSLHHALRSYRPSSDIAAWKERFGLSRRRLEPPLGLYLYGGVGRGKSMLMDLFFQGAPVTRKRRVHFHAFMQEIHGRLKDLRGGKGGEGDLISLLVKDLAEDAWLLCFDEFQVSDIADAMILGRLFEALFEKGVVVVLTSNSPPRDLYKDGLQRALFLPFIDLIARRLDVLELDAGLDYRLCRMREMDVYLVPADKKADKKLEDYFVSLSDGIAPDVDEIQVQGRCLIVPRAAEGVAFAHFDDFCAKPLGPADYLGIAGRYNTLVLSGIPHMGPEHRNEAKRFITLIDTLYEHRVNLICSADVPAEELFVAGDGAFEFARAVSRLMEMRSEEYMAQPHKVS